MTKAKKETVETPVEETQIEGATETPSVVVPIEESTAKKELRALIEAYKIQNPVKYEQKKANLEARLDKLDNPEE